MVLGLDLISVISVSETTMHLLESRTLTFVYWLKCIAPQFNVKFHGVRHPRKEILSVLCDRMLEVGTSST